MNEKNDEKKGHDDPAKIYQINSRKFIPGYDGLYALAQILLAENLPDNAEILIIGAGRRQGSYAIRRGVSNCKIGRR